MSSSSRSPTPYPSRTPTSKSPAQRLSSSLRAPDFAEAIAGWRAWRVVRSGNGLVLASVVRDHVWQPRRPFVASCARSHIAPGGDCVCGVHAARRRSDLRRYLVGRIDSSTVAFVAGEVSLWGTVVECERGWRAERAYPLRLCVPPDRPELAAALAVYGVPLAHARPRLRPARLAHNGDHHDQGGNAVDDPRDTVRDELEDRLDNPSTTLTDDEMTTSWDTQTTGVLGDADDADADDADADDADDTGL